MTYKAILVIGTAIAAFQGAAYAQTIAAGDTAVASERGIGDIVVTAQKRQSSVDKVPVAVTAISGGDLARLAIDDVQSIAARVPNFNYSEAFGSAKISLRGVSYNNLSTGGEGSIAYNLNDVYVSRPSGQVGNFYDVDRVEVLRGPQGTLYGRNATGGTFNLYTARPTWETDGFAQFTVGSQAETTFEGAFSDALVDDKLAARIAVYGTRREGYGENIFNGKDVDDNRQWSGRLSLLAKPAANFSVLIVGDYGRQSDRSNSPHHIADSGTTGEPGTDGRPSAGVQLGGNPLFKFYDVNVNFDPKYDRTGGGALVDAELKLDDVTLRSISAWRHTHYRQQSDLDESAAKYVRIFYGEDANQYSQEFNLNYTSRAFDLTLGAYGFIENLDGFISVPLFDLSLDNTTFAPVVPGSPNSTNYSPGVEAANYYGGGSLLTHAFAAYGQADVHVDDRLTVSLGGRFSTEKKKEGDLYTDYLNAFTYLLPFDPASPKPKGPFVQSKKWNSFTPKVGVNFQMTPDTLLYGSISKGFKAGLFNLGAASALPGRPNAVSNPAVDPETVWAYEAGFKTRMLDNRLRLALAAFYYDYSDMQLTKVLQTVVQLTNAAKARIYGVEYEVAYRPVDNLTLSVNGGWLHARFTEFMTGDPARASLGQLDLTGNRLPQAPEFANTANIDWKMPLATGDITFHGDVFWTSKVYFSEFNRSVVSQAAYAKANASIGWSNGHGLSILAFMKNIFDERTVDTAYVGSGYYGYPVSGFLAPPRTYGVRARMDF